LEVAAELRKPTARVWLEAVQDHIAFLGAVLSVINPNQFNSGISTIERIRSNPEKVKKREVLPDLLNIWTSPSLAMSLMSNRDSPYHHDNGGSYASMDMLVSVGNYKEGKFQAPGLGMEFSYSSGTVITVAGRVIRHGATTDAERLCMSLYQKENIFLALDVSEPDWVHIDDLILLE
jgi:hypothetical protein